ncbi:alpha/beta fold hydrolase [Caulobacter sp. CCH9-E1]|jgi:pimeloyl-ACP methyl ester carboxylesterase|uniref:alpha/beta fold hydrolase n=1 Tax=Caulobacter sp. CCH9-E1 TaxID=1768768 RepID=UPI0008340B59|nr:alpha/beta fold hydrolase [Caulobacter sp. CCH9-E1]
MARFILVHGAWHGAWCWSRLETLLQRQGHSAEAIDLPGVGEAAAALGGIGLADCARAIVEAIGNEPVWLVGHSLGGAAIAAAAAMRPDRVEALVYVAASAPLAGESHLQALGLGPAGAAVPKMIVDAERGVAALSRSDRIAAFYSACPDGLAGWAADRCATWQALGPAAEPLPRDPPADLARFYVQCARDETIPLETQAAMSARLALAGCATLDTDHSPFLSNPAALAEAIAEFEGSLSATRRARSSPG